MPRPPAEETLRLLQGTLDVLVLETMRDGPRHGYDVARLIRDTSDEALQVEEGALYTALHRMQERGWLSASWGISESGRRAKYYRLTVRGRRELERQSRLWSRYAEAVFKVLGRAVEEGAE